MDAFYVQEGDDLFLATELCRGPWDSGAQHGGPPTALLARALTAAVPAELALARITVDFLRPVPLGPLRLEVQPGRTGRLAGRVVGRLMARDQPGRPLVEAAGLFVRREPFAELPWGEPWPGPDDADRFVFPFFRDEPGYHQGVEVRLLDPPWGTTPARCWARAIVALVAGTVTTPEEQVLVVADAESGMGPPLPVATHTFVNPDLTVYFARPPAPGWVGLDIRSWAGSDGAGLSESRLRDARGVFGRSAQSLVVSSRSARTSP